MSSCVVPIHRPLTGLGTGRAQPGALRAATALLYPALSAITILSLWFSPAAQATPANKAALERHYDRFLTKNLNRCSTCHLPSDKKSPETLEEFPHNPFGDRLRRVSAELATASSQTNSKSPPTDLGLRLTAIASEDSDGDGVSNETEILLGSAPGDAASKAGAWNFADTKEGKLLSETLTA